MSEIIFISSNIVVAVMCAAVNVWMITRAYIGRAGKVRLIDDVVMSPRVWMGAAFLLSLALHCVSMTSVCHGGRLEIYPTQTLTLLYMAYVVFTMFSAFTMGRNHYKRLSLWVQLLQLPVVLLFVNLLMTASGNYRPLFSIGELAEFRVAAPLVFYGRVIFITLLFVMWVFCVALNIEAALHSSSVTALGKDDAERKLIKWERILMTSWNVLLLLKLLTLAISHYLLYFAFDILIIGVLCVSAYCYYRLSGYVVSRHGDGYAFRQIEQRVEQLLELEHGGITPWGIHVDENPFYKQGNPVLEDIACAIDADREKLSAYVHQHLHTSVVSWSSELRLRRCAVLIRDGDRQVKDIALTCGYNDLATFSRAFKRLYGVSPSEYRKKESK